MDFRSYSDSGWDQGTWLPPVDRLEQTPSLHVGMAVRPNLDVASMVAQICSAGDLAAWAATSRGSSEVLADKDAALALCTRAGCSGLRDIDILPRERLGRRRRAAQRLPQSTRWHEEGSGPCCGPSWWSCASSSRVSEMLSAATRSLR